MDGRSLAPEQDAEDAPGRNHLSPRQQWSYAKKFLDYLEANAGEFWRVPHLEAFAEGSAAGKNEDQEDEDQDPAEESESLFSAAYEHLTYRDSTDDGIDSSLFETGPDAAESELVFEAERIVGHLAFLAMIAHLWKMTATVSLTNAAAFPQRDEVLASGATRRPPITAGCWNCSPPWGGIAFPPPAVRTIRWSSTTGGGA